MKLGKGVWRCAVACQVPRTRFSSVWRTDMSCRLPVCSEFYSFPSLSSALFCRELDPVNYTPQNPANWLSIRSRQGDTLAMSSLGRWEGEPTAHPLSASGAMPSSGGSRRLWAPKVLTVPGAAALSVCGSRSLCSSSGSNRRSRADAGVDSSKESTALRHYLGSLFFWW